MFREPIVSVRVRLFHYKKYTKKMYCKKSRAISNVHVAEGGCEGGCLDGCGMAEPRRVDIHRSQIHPPEHPHARANRLQGSSFPHASKIPTHLLA